MRKHLFKVNAIMFLLAVSLFNSCKKSDVKNDTSQKTDDQKLIERLRSLYKNFTQNVLYTVNGKGKGMYTDVNGNPINWTTARISEFACYDPADDVDGDLAPNLTLNSVEVKYGCSAGYNVAANWRISVPYHLVNANPNNSSQLSRGRVRLKNSSGTFYHTQGTITPVTLTLTGTENINGVDRYVYNVKYESANISATTFSTAVLVQVAGFFYTDCPDVPTVTIAYSDTYSADVSSNNNICKRTDRIYVAPAMFSNGVLSSQAGFAGVNAIATCSGTYTASHNVTVTNVGTGFSQSFSISSVGAQNLSNANFNTTPATIKFEYFNTGNGCTAGTEPHVTEIWNW